jgi:phage terminase small subunit
MPGTPGRTGLGKCKKGVDRTSSDGLPVKPRGMSKAAASKWKELMNQLEQSVLRKADSHQLRLLAEILAQTDSVIAALAENPDDLGLHRVFMNYSQQVHRLSAQFGLSPGDRQRLDFAPPKEEDSPVEQLRARLLKGTG